MVRASISYGWSNSGYSLNQVVDYHRTASVSSYSIHLLEGHGSGKSPYTLAGRHHCFLRTVNAVHRKLGRCDIVRVGGSSERV